MEEFSIQVICSEINMISIVVSKVASKVPCYVPEWWINVFFYICMNLFFYGSLNHIDSVEYGNNLLLFTIL